MVKNKKYIFIVILIILVIGSLIIILNHDKNLLCKKEINNNKYKEVIDINIEFDRKINKYLSSKKYIYNEGYMDNVVDRYDNIKAYLDIINEKEGVNSNISQDSYNLEYSIDIDFDKNNKDDYKLLEVEEINKLDNIKDIKKYYEDLGYTCK